MHLLSKRGRAAVWLAPLSVLFVRSVGAEEVTPTTPPPSEARAARAATLELPGLLTRTDPVYPTGQTERGVVQVALLVVVETDGRPGAISVAQSAGELFDAEALRTVRSWTFTPAKQAGQPVASRVRVLVEFVPPKDPSDAEVAATQEDALGDDQHTAPEGALAVPHRHGDEATESGDAHWAVTVHGERALRTERRAPSDVFIHREILTAAPHQDAVDTLSTVPGFVAGRGEGVAVAHAYSLRGFHAEHGQDIAFSVAGLPINLPSHIHGQGYADLNLLMPEVVDEVSVSEGNADPAQGDFAMAGSIDLGLGVDEQHRGLSSRTSYGSFQQFRQALVWAPKEAKRESFGAAQFSDSAGYGERRRARSGSLLVQHRFGTGKLSLRAVGLLHTAHGQSAGLLRNSDVEQNRVCFDCVYDDPSARDQAMLAQRAMAGVFVDYRGREHATGSIGLWGGLDRFRARSNLTGYTLGTANDEGLPLSDASEQTNRTGSVGLSGRYRSEAFHVGQAVHGTLEVGGDARLDSVEQKKDLLDAALRDEVWSQKIDAQSTIAQLGMWADLDVELHRRVHVRGGARVALLTYAVDDRATLEAHDHGQEGEPPDEHSAEPTQNAADALFVGPRTSLEVDVVSGLHLLASYGHGYRSPQARTLAHGEQAEYSVVRSGDVGFRFGVSDHVVLSGAGYLAYVGQDLVFEPHVGGLVNVGSSRRAGGLLHLRIHPIEALQGALSVNYVDARILKPSSDEHDEHDEHDPDEVLGDVNEGHSHGEPGDPVVGVAPLSVRLDLNWKKPLRRIGAHPLVFGVGSGLTYRSPKPLGEDSWGSTWLLLDASAQLVWGPVELQLSGFNLLQQKYATEEYLSVSTWDATGATAPSEDHHIAAGPPLSFMATLGLLL